MITHFIGRHRQLAALHKFYTAQGRHLATIRGRRRVGKSRLLLHSLEEGKSAYHQASQLTPEANFARFHEDMQVALRPLLPEDVSGELTHAQNWRSLLLALGQAAQHLGRLTIAIDEFPYLTRSDSSLESVVQEAIGKVETLRQPLKLVLCGSSISQMEALIEHSSPLFGRSDLNLVLHPLDYLESAQFTPAWAPAEQVQARTVFGGMPRYLNLLSDDESVGENYERLVLDPDGALHEETTRLLSAELSEPRTYASIMMAISQGRTKAGEIITAAGVHSSSLQKYLERLEELGLVQRRRSVDASPAAKNLRYVLSDPFIASWYRYALPNLSALKVRGGQGAWQRIVAPTIDHEQAGNPATFEEICRHWLTLHMDEFWSGEHSEVGTLIQGSGQQAAEIDVACALGRGQQKRWLVGECKWQHQPVDGWALKQLQENVARRLGEVTVERWLLFAKAGFTPEVRRDEGNQRLVTLDELYG